MFLIFLVEYLVQDITFGEILSRFIRVPTPRFFNDIFERPQQTLQKLGKLSQVDRNKLINYLIGKNFDIKVKTSLPEAKKAIELISGLDKEGRYSGFVDQVNRQFFDPQLLVAEAKKARGYGNNIKNDILDKVQQNEFILDKKSLNRYKEIPLQRKDLLKAQEAVDDNIERESRLKIKGRIDLSSSWLKSGNWIGTGDSGGDLTLWLIPKRNKKGRLMIYGPYTWPGVPKVVWIAMVSAKGRDGTGAGSVFWALFWRKVRRQSFRKEISKAFKARKEQLAQKKLKVGV